MNGRVNGWGGWGVCGPVEVYHSESPGTHAVLALCSCLALPPSTLSPRPEIHLFIVATSAKGLCMPSLGPAALPWNRQILHNVFLQPEQ